MNNLFDQYADWQWNVNAWGKQDNPSTSINIYLMNCHMDNQTKISNIAFEWLVYGQRHNKKAVELYYKCREFGDEHLYISILGSSHNRQVNIAEVRNHIEWQTHNNPLSLLMALRSWKLSQEEMKKWHSIEAVYQLLSGQRHNSNACQLYRSCFSKQPKELFEIVEEMVLKFVSGELLHPWILGEEPSPTNIRDQIPK